jgi:hypothetical protein
VIQCLQLVQALQTLSLQSILEDPWRPSAQWVPGALLKDLVDQEPLSPLGGLLLDQGVLAPRLYQVPQLHQGAQEYQELQELLTFLDIH